MTVVPGESGMSKHDTNALRFIELILDFYYKIRNVIRIFDIENSITDIIPDNRIDVPITFHIMSMGFTKWRNDKAIFQVNGFLNPVRFRMGKNPLHRIHDF
jgi:hypothetical protein